MNKIRILIIPAVILAAIIPFLFKKTPLTTDITVLLPDDPWISDHVDFLRNSRIGSITAVSITAETQEKSPEIAKFAEKFSNLTINAPGVKEISYRFSPESFTGMAAFLMMRKDRILNKDDLIHIEKTITPENIEKMLKEHYENLMRPGGIFLQKMVKTDPLNLNKLIIKKIEKAGKNSGFKFILRDNGLWSEDGKSFLILVYNNVPVTDAVKGEKYLDMIEKNLNEAIQEKGYSYTIISGHRHAIENQKILKRDIAVTLTIAGLGFFLLFAIFFRDWKALFVFLIPIFGMFAAVGLTFLFFKKPSAIILGLGATVIGIALDYGIHVFVSVKNSENKEKSIKNVLRPLIFSALTTLGVFWAFFFSGTPGYHQMAFVSTCGIAISLILSICCLPLFINPQKGKKEKESIIKLNFSFPDFSKKSAGKTAIVWLFFIFLSITASFYIDFESDIRKMDGSEKILKKEKDEFSATWGESSQGAVVVKDTDFESAMEKHDMIAKFAEKEKIPAYQSLSGVWPSKKTREKNISNWNDFWNTERINFLKKELHMKSEKFGFSETAFEDFFNTLNKHQTDDDLKKQEGFNLFTRKFVSLNKEDVTVNAFFRDKKESVEDLKKITSEIEGATVVSPKSFGDYISKKILDDSYNIAIIAIILVVLLVWICLKNPSDALMALIPVISAILSVAPVYLLSGWKINAITLVSMIVVSGLAIDYGIFAVSSIKNEEIEFSRNAFTALTISMLSTIIGSGALLFASHPALNTVGRVITTGVIIAYFSAILAVPAIASIKNRYKLEK